MAASSLCRLQVVEKAFAATCSASSANKRSLALPLTPLQLNTKHVGGPSSDALVSHLQTPRKRLSKRPLVCRAEGGSVNQAKQGTLEHIPVAPFYKVEAVIRSWRLQGVTEALLAEGIRGLTVMDVRGFGAQRGSLERQAGSEFLDSAFLQKTKIEIVVVSEQVDSVIDTIIDSAKTEEIGDGKIFVSPVYEVIRVRTGERGRDAERMAGGRSDLLNIGKID